MKTAQKTFTLFIVFAFILTSCATYRPMVDMQGKNQKMYNVDIYQ